MSWISITNLVLTLLGWLVSFFKFILPYLKKSLPYVLCFILGWMACSNRIFSRHKKETLIGTEKVMEVVEGNHLKIQAGLLGRRYADLYLWGIEIPKAVSQQSKENLSKYIDSKDDVRVETMESWGRYAGVIYADNGSNCCLEQLRAGLAKTTVDRKDFNLAQKEAQKNKRGIWK
jgi:hypothetical protein